ncbi:MAG TPA: carbamoyltransferase HypF [Streptosporangiaceae bacterium]|nr:carbamoyltransferase HypF [Streptosporangiaceae bacterium]
MSQRVRTLVRVEGIVQGVGFRPFVYSLATRLGLAGWVGNDVVGVFAEVEGPAPAVREFLLSLQQDAPPLARIERVTTENLRLNGSSGFTIAPSESGGRRSTLVSPDTNACDDCLRELADPADRRFGYPFINCTNCGPRFTIVRDVPYDRPLTTMAGFVMCAQCAAEYNDPADRRFHAQPVCCPACGPRLRLHDAAGAPLPGEPLAATAGLLRRGQVLAIKGLGGYHLAVDAANESAAAALRDRKHREDKPFAIMVASVAVARELCEVDEAAESLLTSGRRPIVLLPRRSDGGLAAAVAPRNRQLGVMLPYTPLHHLLVRLAACPIVLTSGNSSDEPIVYADDDAVARLGSIADAFLTHDRAIHVRTDDSVVRAFRGKAAMIRRSRGYVPEPVPLGFRLRRPVLACGAELKNTFCLAKGDRAFLSQHIGDLENFETLRSFTDGIEHFKRLFDIAPQLVAHDLHPEYLSTKYAAGLTGVELAGVQHHHAHIASCLADNGEQGPVIGVAFDGTGYGSDGTIWGGEFLIADLAGFERAGHLSGVPMPGGAAAIRQPWRMAAAYLDAAYPDGHPGGLAVARRNERRWDNVISMARRGLNSPVTSSAGRLFDAAAAILGVRDLINYEGQAAIELEQLADPAERGAYQAGIEQAGTGQAGIEQAGTGQAGRWQDGTGLDWPLRLSGADLIRAVTEDLLAGTDAGVISARFHNGIATVIEAACLLLGERHGLPTVALSGGVFQNLLLLHRTVNGLEDRGFRVLVHSWVPCNDGGISFGQAVVAATRDRAAAQS